MVWCAATSGKCNVDKQLTQTHCKRSYSMHEGILYLLLKNQGLYLTYYCLSWWFKIPYLSLHKMNVNKCHNGDNTYDNYKNDYSLNQAAALLKTFDVRFILFVCLFEFFFRSKWCYLLARTGFCLVGLFVVCLLCFVLFCFVLFCSFVVYVFVHFSISVFPQTLRLKYL